METSKREWTPPKLEVFGDMETLTQLGQGNGTGNTGSGQCSGKGCGTGDSLRNDNPNALTGFSSSV